MGSHRVSKPKRACSTALILMLLIAPLTALGLLAFAPTPAAAQSWTDTGGGDHGGADWTITSGTTIADNHYNIGVFKINSGVTVTVSGWVEIHAENVIIEGAIWADGANGDLGQAGANGGTITIQGTTVTVNSFLNANGGRGGYGGLQSGNGGNGGSGGTITIQGTTVTVNSFLNADGGDGGYGDIGGTGANGGTITIQGTTVTVNDFLNANGGTAGAFNNGGSGGTITIQGTTVTVNSSLGAEGGPGGYSPTSYSGNGGTNKIVYGDSYTLGGSFCHSESGGPGGYCGIPGRPGTYSVMRSVADAAMGDMGLGADASDSLDTAAPISTGSDTGHMDNTDTADHYQIYLTSGQTISVTLTPPSGSDFDLHLYDPAQSQVASSILGGDNTENVSYTATSSGYHYIHVDRADGEGNYSLSVAVTEGAAAEASSSPIPVVLAVVIVAAIIAVVAVAVVKRR